MIVSSEILFLDEPTTGLDITAAISLIRLLKEYVHSYVTFAMYIKHSYFLQFESTRSSYYPFRTSTKIFYLQII